MKRTLISAIAIAVLIAGCGSGGSTTPAASKAKTSTTKTTTTTHKKHKKVVIKKTKRVVHRSKTSSSGGAGVTTTAVTTTAATTTTTPPPPTTTHTTHTTTHSAPPPVTTHQQPPPKHHHHNGGHGGGYCLSATDRIATPSGSVLVTQVTPGMDVWSTNSSGQRIDVKVTEVHHTAVPASHMMVDLHLVDGRTVLASLGHPLPNGEPISSLTVGQAFEGTRVVSDARVVYGRPYTYDLLPAGPTHTYYADGVLLGSTLAPSMFSHLF